MRRPAQSAGVAVGLFLMVAPGVFGYAGSSAGDLHRVIGPVVASLAVIAAWQATMGARWPNLVCAVVLATSPLLVYHPAAAATVGVLSGVALGGVTPFGGARDKRFGGGWTVLIGRSGATPPR